MCRETIIEDEKAYQPASARCVALGEGTWVVGLALSGDHPARTSRPATRFHFVLDNSASMGSNTLHAKDCFAELVEVANGPCSLTVFENQAASLGENFTTAKAMRATPLPRQGGTNITAGVQAALDIVRRCEEDEVAHLCSERTHHVLVLLSDGAHNRGPRPEEQLPVLGGELRDALPALRLSVVVVGVTRGSNTSMGMLLKQSLETVALPSLEPIYFAATPQLMGDALGQMHEGLASLRGSPVRVGAPDGVLFTRAVGEAGVPSLDVLVDGHEHALLCSSEVAPSDVTVDGVVVPCAPPPESAAQFDTELAAAALEALVDAVRVRRVASGAEGIQLAVQQLGGLISALEAKAAAKQAASADLRLNLARASPAERVEQHRALKRATFGARELRNQLAEIEAHKANDSASQAAFLTGASSKYGAKALRRAAAHGPAADGSGGAVDPNARFQEMLTDLERVSSKMRQALREDLLGKVSALAAEQRLRLKERLEATPARRAPQRAIERICSGDVTAAMLASDEELANLVDGGALVEPLLTVTGGMRRSYLSLQTPWEQMKEWCDAPAQAAAACQNEYQLLMYLGASGYPIDVQRRAATQMDPFAMDVARVRAALADTASLSTALHSDQPVVPPEGGRAVEEHGSGWCAGAANAVQSGAPGGALDLAADQDLLVLVDPDAPRASKLVASSLLLREAYTSVVLCRDLHMYTGGKMRLALHAHALLAALQPPPAEAPRADLEAQLRRQYLGRAFQCGQCGFGPIDHFACGDLEAHHGEDVGGAVINNACPHCGWFSSSLSDWPRWDGTLPPSARDGNGTAGESKVAECATAASLELALRICYSARAFWRADADGEARALCGRLASWETLTTADGIDHPVQLLLALAVSDEVPEEALGVVPRLMLLNEVCARRARDQLRQSAGTDEGAVTAAAQSRVARFLGVTPASAPHAAPLEESEPQREAVKAACSSQYALDSTSFDFKAWVREVLSPWEHALRFAQRLRQALSRRQGGWPQLERDMEAGPGRYADVIEALQKPSGRGESLRSWLGVEQKQEATRVLATMAAQAFLHHSSQLRRTTEAGGALREPLGDVRASETLRAMAVDLRMVTYDERVAAKMREWGRLGESITFQRARAADLEQYAGMCGRHAHGLDGATFWGLWRAAEGEKARRFLSLANQGFVAKYGGQ